MKTEKSKKLRGSVLLTVVSVMSLLMIFLSGTLVLASAANNRAHINYSSAQAGITSRAVADAALKAISDEAHPEYASAILSLDSSSAPIKVPISINSSSTNTGSFGNIQDVTVEYAGTKKYYNEDSKAWEEKDLLKFTSNVTLGGVTSTTTSYVVKDPPQPSGGGSGGAGFVTAGGATFTDQTILYGGSYINLPTLDKAKDYNYSYTSPNYLSDYELEFNNSGGFEANTMINGSIDMGRLNELIFPGKGKGITVWGDMTFNNVSLSSDGYVSNPNMSVSNFDSANPIDFKDIPYIYVDGKITAKQDGQYIIGNKNNPFPLNVFCGYVDSTGSAGFDVVGDIYCMNPNETSKFGNSGHKSKLYSWSSSVINKADNTVSSGTRGSLYSKGSVEISGNNGLDIAKDLCVEGDLVVDGPLNVGGDLVVGGKIIMNGGSIRCAGLYCDNIIGSSVNNIYVNGVQVISGERPVKEGYTSVDNKHIDVSTDPITTVENDQYEYELQNVDMGGWSKNMYVDKFGNKYDTWANPGTYYYEEVDIDGNPLGVKADGEFTYFDGYGTKLDPSGYLEVNSDGSLVDPSVYTSEQKSYFDDMGNRVSESDMYDGGLTGVSSIADYGDDVYPKYAERDVILGLETIDGHPKEDTQVVMTMQDVLENVVNPYDNSQLPNKIQKIYDDMKADLSTYQLDNYTEMKNFMDGDKYAKSIKVEGNNTKIEYVSTEAGCLPVINKSCILKGFTLGDGGENLNAVNGMKTVVINPGNDDILLVLDGVNFNGDEVILVDDSGSGSVYFYVEPNSTFTTRFGVITTRYYAMSKNKTSFQVYSDPSYARKVDGVEDPPSLEYFGLGKPRVYFYSGDSASFNITNFCVLTANIISSNLSLNFGSTNKDYFSGVDVYYNGNKSRTNNKLLIGCSNSKTTAYPNEMSVIYVPDTSTPPAVATPDLSHWFKVLYYDEY